MTSRLLRATSCCVLLSACDAAQHTQPTAVPIERASALASVAVPGDGNGNKDIIQVFVQNLVNCGGGVTLTRTVEGWIQVNSREHGGSEIPQVTVYRVNYTFTNAAGAQFVVRETGIDRAYVEDGVMYLQLSGKTPVHTGVIRINQASGEQVFEAGQDFDLLRTRACEALA